MGILTMRLVRKQDHVGLSLVSSLCREMVSKRLMLVEDVMIAVELSCRPVEVVSVVEE